jgi:hypothetical protein
MSMIEAQGWGPPGTWSQHPPGCDCGCQDSGWGSIRDCWRQVSELKAIIRQVVKQEMLGVTDGSDAKPGEIGEYFLNVTTFNFTAAQQTQNVNAGVIGPGDWDVIGAFMPSVGTSGIKFNLSPVPTGVTTDMSGLTFDQGDPTASGPTSGAMVISTPARALIKVPTLFSFSVNTNFAGTVQAGTATFTLQARRVR